MARRTILLVFVAALLGGCDRPPSDGIRDWTPDDHDHLDQQKQGGPAPSSEEDKRAMVIEAAWATNCAVCHGQIGHGDGPNGTLVKAPDLTRPEWQDRVADQEIAARIREGKGLMPKFDLPNDIVLGLVARIRVTKGR